MATCQIDPDSQNGLNKTSSVDARQLRSLALERFIRKPGYVSAITLEAVVAAIAAVVEFS